MRAVLTLALAMALAACTTQRMTDIADGVPTQFSEKRPNPLLHSVALGDVSGGASIFNELDITNNEFSILLTTILRRNALSAPKGQGRYQLDCRLDYDTPITTLGDQTVHATVQYTLRDKASGSAVFDTTVVTSDTAQTRSAAAEVGLFLLAGNIAGNGRRFAVNDRVTRENVDQFLVKFADWARSEYPPPQ